MIISAFLPLILIAFIIGLIVYLSMQNFEEKGIFVKWTKLLFLIYVIILLLSTIIFYLIPKEEMTNEVNISQEEYWIMLEDFYQSAFDGKMSDMDEDFIKKTWEFEFHEDIIHFAVDGDMNIGVTIIAERKQQNDGKIEALLYEMPTIIDNIDISDQIKPINLNLTANTLTMLKPEPIEVRINKPQKEMVVTQFFGEQWRGMFQIGSRLIYFRIPKDIKWNNDTDLHVEFVEA